MNIGIIYCVYGNPDYVNDCLQSWIEARKDHNIKIAAVHGQFKEYHDLGIEDFDITTQLALKEKYYDNKIDFLYIQNENDENNIYQTEAEIRDRALKYLLRENVDYVIFLDNDEFYTRENIDNIINYINQNNLIGWFSINFKNYVLDAKCWVDGFCPPRVFKVNLITHRLSGIYWDNDCEYQDKKTGDKISYKSFATKPIPKSVAHIKHLTWLHSNGKLKYEYQMRHFGHCGYKWNYETNQLEFNLEFHKKHNIPIPELNYD
jgi:hypothetical protein